MSLHSLHRGGSRWRLLCAEGVLPSGKFPPILPLRKQLRLLDSKNCYRLQEQIHPGDFVSSSTSAASQCYVPSFTAAGSQCYVPSSTAAGSQCLVPSSTAAGSHCRTNGPIKFDRSSTSFFKCQHSALPRNYRHTQLAKYLYAPIWLALRWLQYTYNNHIPLCTRNCVNNVLQLAFFWKVNIHCTNISSLI